MINNDTIGITPPGTVGFSQYFLIEVQYADLDGSPVLLPYFNAANPPVPWSGPNNTGVSQNTVRQGIAAVQIKAGTAAATGTQTPPVQDAGWIGLFLVLVAQGQTSITSGNITPYNNGINMIQNTAKLGVLPGSVLGQAFTYWADTSVAANTLTIAPTPPIAAYATGQRVCIKVNNTNTGAVTGTVSGLSSQPFNRRDGSAMVAGDIVVGQSYDFLYTGAGWNAMDPLASEFARNVNNPTIFVRTDGNDNNDGSANSSAKAMLTVQAAINRALAIYSLGGKVLTIQLGIAGTYLGNVLVPPTAGQITILGSGSTYVLSASGAGASGCFQAQGSNVTFNNLGLTNSGTTANTIAALAGGVITLTAVSITNTSVNANSHIQVFPGGAISINSVTINAVANQMGFALQTTGGNITMPNGSTFTFAGGPTYSSQTASASICGTMTFAGTFSGAVTGTRYSVTLNGVINTFGGGANFIPGSVAGSSATGGQYA